MKKLRCGIDRRSNINRRLVDIGFRSSERRKGKRRVSGERRDCWMRSSEWSSIDIHIKNRYFWCLLEK